MATSASETSYWINFFTNAGIPAGDAMHYAILFTDNRISSEMLLDINKEYLTDMGITRLGDIIAILKHCKTVYNQEAKDRILKSTSLTSSSIQSSLQSLRSSPLTPRRSTAASRMVNHFTSKHPEAAPMSSIPVPKLPPADPPRSKRKVSVFERLSQDNADEEISLTTSSSVFNRLGGKSSLKRSASAATFSNPLQESSAPEILPYAGVLKNDSPSPTKKPNIKVAVTSSAERVPKLTQASLRIKKVIHNTAAVKGQEDKKTNIQKRLGAKTADDDVSSTQVISKKKPVVTEILTGIQRPEISTTTAGVLSDHAMKDAPKLRDRLGTKGEVASSTDAFTDDISPPSVKRSKLITKTFKSNIQKRLGAKTADDDVSSTQGISKKKPMAIETKDIFSRLGKHV